ncbi:helix-turn-helix transcriptional regulator [bacterium]|nr:helix-turn-helix transcriptional regulator [bacterium]
MVANICKNFAKKLKEIREDKKLTKGQLSSLADLDVSYIGKIERCEKFPTIKTIAKLAVALDVPAKDLFDFE